MGRHAAPPNPDLPLVILQIFERQAALGMSVNDLAKKSGYSRSNVFRLRYGKRDMSFPMIVELAQTVGLEFILVEPDIAEAIRNRKK
jgi:transcriptional regulator with XRE-family HTH domain